MLHILHGRVFVMVFFSHENDTATNDDCTTGYFNKLWLIDCNKNMIWRIEQFYSPA